jgi:muramidase (phage lysozyme)
MSGIVGARAPFALSLGLSSETLTYLLCPLLGGGARQQSEAPAMDERKRNVGRWIAKGTAALASALMIGCAGDVDPEETAWSEEELATKTTCSAERANGAVNRYEKALHDTIAYAEGTKGRLNDGYSITYAYRSFSSCARHPNMRITAGGYTSTAAGRYQYLKKTWDNVERAAALASFEPENQEKAAAWSIKHRGVTVPPTTPMTRGQFAIALRKLSLEWASLPGSPYGQPRRSEATLWTQYCAALGGCE